MSACYLVALVLWHGWTMIGGSLPDDFAHGAAGLFSTEDVFSLEVNTFTAFLATYQFCTLVSFLFLASLVSVHLAVRGERVYASTDQQKKVFRQGQCRYFLYKSHHKLGTIPFAKHFQESFSPFWIYSSFLKTNF
jgi:hypothetical protein